MKAAIIVSFSFLLLITSCNQKKEEKSIDWNQYPTVELTNPTWMVIPEYNFDSEQDLKLINDNYFFSMTAFSQLGELNLYQIYGDTLKWEGLITKNGEGPLETSTHSETFFTSDEDIVVLSTHYRTQIFKLPKEQISDRCDLSKWDKYTVPKQVGFIDKMIPIDATRFLVTTVGDVPSMFATYHLGDTALSFIPCSYPESEFKNASKAVMYSGHIYKHPGKEKYFYQCSSGRYMYTFTLKDNQMENITYLYNEPPLHKLQKDGVNTYIAYETLLGSYTYVTENYIYTKLVNFTMGDLGDEYDRNNGYPCWFNNEIKVFNWDGEPVESYKFDHYLSHFVVDSQDRFLYGMTKDVETDDASLIKYTLKE